jgi:hypothetical protein
MPMAAAAIAIETYGAMTARLLGSNLLRYPPGNLFTAAWWLWFFRTAVFLAPPPQAI